MRVRIVAGILSLTAAVFAVSQAAAQRGEEIKPLKSWMGRVTANQAKLAPKEPYIINQKVVDTLWKDWKIEGKAPKVDFEKNLILIALSRSSGVGLTPRLDKKSGNLEMSVIVTDDITDDYGYHMVLIPSAGIKTINGKAIARPKEKQKEE